MKDSISKPVLAIVGLGLVIIATLVWFKLRPASGVESPAVVKAEKSVPTPALPAFLLKSNATPVKSTAATPKSDDHLLKVIPISLVKFLSEDPAYAGSAMKSLPGGTRQFGGVEFWLQGILRLQGTGTRDNDDAHFPETVVVPLDETNLVGEVVERGRDIATAYILGGALHSSKGTDEKLADVVWHYDDGTASSVLKDNVDLRDWVRQPYEDPARLPSASTKVAWRGPHPSRKDISLRLYRVALVNPHPEKVIRALEFKSAMNRPSLFVAALTLDPLLPGARLDNLTSDEMADPVLNGLIQVTVLDAEGHALADAQVSANTRNPQAGSSNSNSKSKTDSSGVAQMRYADADLQSLKITAGHEGFSERQMQWDISGGDKIPESYTLKLSAEVKVSGIVVDEAGNPISGAKVNLYRFWRGSEDRPDRRGEQPAFTSQNKTTGADGRWQANGLPASLLGNIGFGITHPDYVGASDNIADNPATEQKLRDGTYKTVLKHGATVKGRVVDGAGSAVPGVTVWAGRKYTRERQQTTADAEGKFSFRNLPDGELPFTAMGKGFAPSVKLATVAANMAEVVIHVAPGKELKGHVQDESGQPVASARVGLEGNYDSPSYYAYEFNGNTDANGDFTWDGAPDEELQFYISHQGFEAKRNAKLKPGGENIITLRKARTLTGLVLDAATDKPVTKFSVRTGTANEGNPDQVYGVIRDKSFTAEDGRFTMTLDEESDNAALVTADGYENKVEKFSPGDNGGVQVTVKLKAATVLEGVVLTPDGSPAPGVTVAAVADKNRGGYIQLAGGKLRSYDSSKKVAISDEQGHFKLSTVPDNGLVVAAGEAGFTRVPVAGLKDNATIRLEAWGRIEGTLKIGGEPGAGRDLIFTLQIPGISTGFEGYKATTDTQGRFTIEKVPPGEGSIARLIKTSVNSWSHSDNTTVQVKAGETTPVSLGDNGAVIAGRYRWSFQPTNEPPFNIEARLSSAAPMPVTPQFSTPAEAQAFYRSPEWQAAMRQRKNYSMELLPNNGFAADNVVPGTYSLDITVRVGGDRSWSKPPIAQGHGQVTVPESFNPAEPIDVGDVVLDPPSAQEQ